MENGLEITIWSYQYDPAVPLLGVNSKVLKTETQVLVHLCP